MTERNAEMESIFSGYKFVDDETIDEELEIAELEPGHSSASAKSIAPGTGIDEQETSSPRIAVLGLGNLMRTDDAVGMLALQRLRADPRFPHSVPLIEGGTLGLDLIYPLDGFTHLLALDAIDAGVRPGTVLRYSGDAIADLPISKSVHLLGFSDLIGSMRLIGNAPTELIVLGIQPHTIGWGTELTPPVEAALDLLVERVIDQIGEWSAGNEEGPGAPIEPEVAVLQLAAAEEAWYW